MRYILALDQGTTSSRSIVVDAQGAIASIAQRELTQHFPHPGWVEHDPNEIWESQIAVARQAIAQAGLHARDIAVLGLTNQRETTVVWDRATDQPVCKAIVWQDRRTVPLCEHLKAEGLEPLFAQKTGLLLDAYFSGTKLRWILDHVPEARRNAAVGKLAFGTVDSWLVWKFSGGAHHVIDPTNASRTLLYDIHKGEWDEELLAALKVPAAILPRVVASSGEVARTAMDLLGASIPIAGIAGDQQAALFGQLCIEPGMVKNTYGTGCFMLMHTGERPIPSQHKLLTTVACQIGIRRAYALEGSVFVAGAVVQWLRDALGIIHSSSEVESLAAQVPDNGGVYLVPAFVGLGTPHWDPYARGAIVGLTRGASAAHIARAALEGIAYQVAEVLCAMRADSGIELAELRADGGAARNKLLMQFQADLLRVPVLCPKTHETTALGAAYLAGLGVGLWKDPQDLRAHWHAEQVFEPRMDDERAACLLAGWKKAVNRAQHWAEE